MDAKRLTVGKANNAEDRRVIWMTYFNLKTWFDSWKEELILLGFAYHNQDNEVIILPTT